MITFIIKVLFGGSYKTSGFALLTKRDPKPKANKENISITSTVLFVVTK